jgi:magnesium transporter
LYAPAVPVKVYAYAAGDAAVSELTLDEVPRMVAREDVTLWVDMCGRDPDPVQERLLSNVFKVHPLVLEDMFDDAPQPKVEDYDDFLYVVVHGLDRNAEQPDDVGTIELDVLIGPRWVITHHPRGLRSTEAIEAEIRKSPRLFQRGPSYIAHGILEHLSDHYKPMMERFEEEIDALEARVLEDPDSNPTAQIFALKRSLGRIKRIASHQREVVQRLARGEFERVDRGALPFFRDIANDFVRVTDLCEGHRELLAAIFETYRSVQSQKLNEIMKVLTLISTIMLPMTFIAGVYGMNFEVMPELKWEYGYPFAMLLMIVVAVGLVTYFRKRRWI